MSFRHPVNKINIDCTQNVNYGQLIEQNTKSIYTYHFTKSTAYAVVSSHSISQSIHTEKWKASYAVHCIVCVRGPVVCISVCWCLLVPVSVC